VDTGGVTFSLADPAARFHDVSLFQEVAWPRPGPSLDYRDGVWTARLPRPGVDRMEYLYEVLHPDGGYELLLDPANPRRAPGAFGEKSVIEFPEYSAPAWLAEQPAPSGTLRPVPIDGVATGLLWSPFGTDDAEPLPLLVVHDGLEYAQFSLLRQFLDRAMRAHALPPFRAALLHPTARDEQYSASPAYAEALTEFVLPRLHAMAPITAGRRHRVGMGASLGALAMLHAHRLAPAAFGGLFLQSGSFFHHRYFRHDIGFEHFERIRSFSGRVHTGGNWDLAIPVAMTCGEVEQNFPNNRATRLALRAQGYPVTFHRVRDAHTWVGWRDAFTPGLVDLLTGLWG
jgi:enterochelin esterase-like enzyme